MPHPEIVPLTHLYYPPSEVHLLGEEGKECGGEVERREEEEKEEEEREEEREEDVWRLFRVPPSVRERWGESFGERGGMLICVASIHGI